MVLNLRSETYGRASFKTTTTTTGFEVKSGWVLISAPVQIIRDVHNLFNTSKPQCLQQQRKLKNKILKGFCEDSLRWHGKCVGQKRHVQNNALTASTEAEHTRLLGSSNFTPRYIANTYTFIKSQVPEHSEQHCSK